MKGYALEDKALTSLKNYGNNLEVNSEEVSKIM